MFLILGLGMAIQIHQSWQTQVESSKLRLIRSAEMGNLLIENALLDAAKSLEITRSDLEQALQKGGIDRLKAYSVLMKAHSRFTEYNKSDVLGLVFWIDAQGQLIARTGDYPSVAISMADRFYFQDLRDHPSKGITIGPLLLARTTGLWVFHLAVPVMDGQGRFAGVLVQQLIEHDISSQFAKYQTNADFESFTTQYNGNAVSFQFPSPVNATVQPMQVFKGMQQQMAHTDSPQGVMLVPQGLTGQEEWTWMAYARSPVFGLISLASMPVRSLAETFFHDSLAILIYAAIAGVLIIALFYALNRMSEQLLKAQNSALHDPLTLLNNRRALDENLPRWIRDSMREHLPIAVLFIDIDYFRNFNELYGHESGDVALCEVARCLAQKCRRPMDMICRWGGEEFVAVLPRTPQAAAYRIAQEMLESIGQVRLKAHHHRDLKITVSIGLVVTTITSENLQANLVDMADKAMQKAKADGRNRITLYQDCHADQHQLLAARTSEDMQKITT
jgi:diguanylate cyclase (GGDEF)-like protein